MAIKASAQITISKVIDIYACYRYYKLQSSTLAKPNKPTTNPPSGWSDTEPAYVSGSTNTLYFVDCNVYSDKTFSFSEVSKSSSYEAAKDAWNKANNAQNTVDNLEIGGRNLVPQSLVQQQSMTYGFAGRTLTMELQAGSTYTISFRGRVVDGEGKLAVFLYEPTWKSTTNRNTDSKTNTIVRWSFKPTITGKYIITAYSYLAQGTHGGNVYIDWYKVEKGNLATDWTPAPEDNIAKVDVEYYLSTSATSLAGGSWSTTAPTWVNGKYMWSRTVTVDGAGNKTYSPSQNGVCIAGAKGDTGATGAAGKGVTSIVEQYYKSTSATALSGGSWSTTYPGWENGKYIWTRSVITYTDKSTTTTTAVCVTGTKGDTGAKGDKGDTGKSIGSVTNYYLATSAASGVTTSTSGWTTTVQSVSADKKYLWNYEVIKYSDGTTASTTAPCIIGAYGNTGNTGATGKGISKVTEHYAVSTSNTTPPTSWSDTVPTMTTTNKYLWNYETITYTDNTTSDTAKRVIGVYGNTGATGAAGKGIKSTVITYQTSASGTTAPTGTWSSSVPATTADKPYLWTRTVITYTDNTTSTSYAVGSTPEGISVGGRNLARHTSLNYCTPIPYFDGTPNDCKGLATVYSEGLHIGDIVTVRLVYKYENIVAASGHTAKCWIQGSGNVTNWNSGGWISSPALTLSGSGEETILYSFTITDNMMKNAYWSCNIRHDYVQSGSVCWKEFKVEKGNKATDWTPAPEDAINSVSTEYYLSTSATSLAGGSWSTTAPTWVNGKYMWCRTVITDGSGNKTYSPSQNGVCIAGAKGDTGATGAAGTSLVTLITSYSYNQTEIDTYAKDGYSGSWAVSSTSGVKVNDTILLRVTNTTKNGYCYIIAKVTKVNSATRVTATSQGAVDKGNTGAKGDTGPAGKGISSAAVTYQASTSGTSIPTGTWATSIPSVAAGSYLWTRTIITYTDKTSTTSYAVGKMGNTGATGKGIKSTSITYQAHSNGTTAPTGTWTDLVPTTSAEKPYLWSRTILTYTDNTTSTTYSVGSTPEGVLDEIKKVLRYDDTKITLGRTGSNITLNLQNTDMVIADGEDIRASFESDKLTLGGGYLVLGYDDTASGIGAYLTSSEYDTINLIIPAEVGSLPNGNNISSRLHMWGGTRPAIELSNSEGSDLLVGVIQDEATSEYGSLIRLNAEYIKLQATKKLSYNIPALQSQNCNNITDSGKYYLGNNSTNRPENTNGWLECMKYSTNYCAQTYTTYNGKKYTRYQQNGTWGAWFRVWQSRPLFGNESQAMNTVITLSDSAANYDMLEIFYKTNDSVQNNARVYAPNNKRVSLTSTYYIRSNKNMILKSKTVLISGNKIDTLNLSGHGYATAETKIPNSAYPYNEDADNVGIIRVLGWR